MRKKFSEKYGYTKVKDSFQVESMDERLKKRIWNTIRNEIFDVIPLDTSLGWDIRYQRDMNIINEVYDEYFGVDFQPTSRMSELKTQIKQYYDKLAWYKVYDFLEALVYYHYSQQIKEKFKSKINSVLEFEMSGYRFIDDCIAPIVDEIEIKEIEDVFASKYDSVKVHLAKALEHLSDRENPDYQNSIKESITAVETIAKIITGKNTDLASCLKQINLDLNKQFITGMNNIYGWTCKEDGIRHGHTGEELKTSFDEAKYMLVSCSAFINYLISKHKS